MSDEFDGLRERVAELERRVAVLFQQTGAADWEADARTAAAVSEGVRRLVEAGETRKAAKLYMQETGAGLGEATAARGELAGKRRPGGVSSRRGEPGHLTLAGRPGLASWIGRIARLRRAVDLA